MSDTSDRCGQQAPFAQPMGFVQRWRDRREVRIGYRQRALDEGFSPCGYEVAAIAERRARQFVLQHHYSGSYPAARLAVGLLRQRPAGSELVGVAVFSVPMNQRSIVKYTGVVDPNQGVELGRFVLTDTVGFNAESWFLARALAELTAEKPHVQAVISYSDPIERCDDLGRI